MRKLFVFLLICVPSSLLKAQIHAGLFRYPDVSETHIVFTYANDLWVVPKEGGNAYRLSSPPGVEIFPKYSPDGKTIAYSANYDGNRDVYTVPSLGGVSSRLTFHGMSDRVVDWTPDGKSVLFASLRESEKERFNKFFTISAGGGPASVLPLAYAEYGSYSPDGKRIAVTIETQIGRTWKRYRGGNVADIFIFNLQDNSSEKLSKVSDAGDEFPMWHKDNIYFLSDRGPENRMNLWQYNTATKAFTQLTKFADNDIHYPSLGPSDIVFEQGGKMFLFNISSATYKEVRIDAITDGMSLKPRMEKVEDLISHVSIAPDGSRALMEARGDIFSVPAEFGFVKNLTHSQGVADRYPAWSPDGKSFAYWSDASGEYELVLSENGNERKVTSLGAGFRYQPVWSPDSKKLAFIDKALTVFVLDIASGTPHRIDKLLRGTHGTVENFTVTWSADSRWLSWARDLDNYHSAIFLYDAQTQKTTQATSGYYNCTTPTFDPTGKYLFLLTDQHFSPQYSSIDNTFIYANSQQLAAITLKKGTLSPLYPKNDSVSLKKEDKKTDSDKDKKPDADKKAVDIDIDGFESRLVLLPVRAGTFGEVQAIKGKVLFRTFPFAGAPDRKSSLKFYDIEKREDKTILDDVDFFQVSANGEKVLVSKGDRYAIIKPDENQKMDKTMKTGDLEIVVEPVKEWKQILDDAWRFERDYFYDPDMHGVNWNQVHEQYTKMLTGVSTRDELNYVLGEMIGELNSSHTYRSGGDEESERHKSVGYLGIDWQADGQYYKVKRIVRAAPWDAEARSPLDAPGVNIHEGAYILAVNGVPITTQTEPYAAFQGLGGKTVELTYNTSASLQGAKTVAVETMGDESRLRHLEWIEHNRKRVDEATNGAAGYVYVRSTGVDGQNELIRQFNSQWDKKSMIVDERFNNGGQIPDRFVEMLNRPPIVFWAIRDGKAWPWPQFANYGPKVMLINGWSGSGGDAFPDYFRKAGLGPLIGTRTWGGLIGISGVPSLVDGGGVTVPTFRMYNLDGTWFKEGHGVDPDIVVDEDLTSMAKGVDPQLERAIAEIKDRLKKGFTEPERPKKEKR